MDNCSLPLTRPLDNEFIQKPNDTNNHSVFYLIKIISP